MPKSKYLSTLSRHIHSDLNENPSREGWTTSHVRELTPQPPPPEAPPRYETQSPSPLPNSTPLPTPTSALHQAQLAKPPLLHTKYIKGAQRITAAGTKTPATRMVNSSWGLAPPSEHHNVIHTNIEDIDTSAINPPDTPPELDLLDTDSRSTLLQALDKELDMWTADLAASADPLPSPPKKSKKKLTQPDILDSTERPDLSSPSPTLQSKTTNAPTPSRTPIYSQPGSGIGVPLSWLEPRFMSKAYLLVIYLAHKLRYNKTGILFPFTIPSAAQDLQVSAYTIQTQLDHMRAEGFVHYNYKAKTLVCAPSPAHLAALQLRLAEVPLGPTKLPEIFWNPLTHKDILRVQEISALQRKLVPYEGKPALTLSPGLAALQLKLNALLSEEATFENARKKPINDSSVHTCRVGVPTHLQPAWYQAIPLNPSTQSFFGISPDNPTYAQFPTPSNPHPGPDFIQKALGRTPRACYTYLPLPYVGLLLGIRPYLSKETAPSPIIGPGYLSPMDKKVLLLLAYNADIRSGELPAYISKEKICHQLGIQTGNHHRVSKSLQICEFIGILKVEKRKHLYQCDQYKLIPGDPSLWRNKQDWSEHLANFFKDQADRINNAAQNNPNHPRNIAIAAANQQQNKPYHKRNKTARLSPRPLLTAPDLLSPFEDNCPPTPPLRIPPCVPTTMVPAIADYVPLPLPSFQEAITSTSIANTITIDHSDLSCPAYLLNTPPIEAYEADLANYEPSDAYFDYASHTPPLPASPTFAISAPTRTAPRRRTPNPTAPLSLEALEALLCSLPFPAETPPPAPHSPLTADTDTHPTTLEQDRPVFEPALPPLPSDTNPPPSPPCTPKPAFRFKARRRHNLYAWARALPSEIPSVHPPATVASPPVPPPPSIKASRSLSNAPPLATRLLYSTALLPHTPPARTPFFYSPPHTPFPSCAVHPLRTLSQCLWYPPPPLSPLRGHPLTATATQNSANHSYATSQPSGP